MTPPVSLSELEALARAATPGIWGVCVTDPERNWCRIEQVRGLSRVVDVDQFTRSINGHSYVYCGVRIVPADRDYIAAISPDVLLSLIDRVREGERKVAKLRAIEAVVGVERSIRDGGWSESGLLAVGQALINRAATIDDLKGVLQRVGSEHAKILTRVYDLRRDVEHGRPAAEICNSVLALAEGA